VTDDSTGRDGQWLASYARRRIHRSERGQRYLAYIDSWDAPLDLSDPGPDQAQRQLAYDRGRSGGGLLARKAFGYAHAGSSLHRNAHALAAVIDGWRSFVSRQDADGRFIWGDGHYYQHGTHEHVWRLEPLIWSRLWLGEAAAPADRRRVDQAIARASGYLVEHPWPDLSNQGVIWCYGLWLASLYLDKPKLRALAQRHADRILGQVLDDQGQVREASWRYYRGGGPCSNYSFTGWTYIMLYRLISGRAEHDPKLIEALRWFSYILSPNGLPMTSGASVRMGKPRVAVSDLLHGLEFYAPREPHFATLAQSYLDECQSQRSGHALHPAIWALLAHRPSPRRPVTPAWARDVERHYDTAPVQYSVVHHRYHTALTMRGLFPRRGIQSFAWGQEPPIIQGGDKLVCTAGCGKIDIASMNVDGGPYGWETHIRRRDVDAQHELPPHWTSIVTRRGGLWECCVFTTDSVIYLIGGGRGTIHATWALNPYQPTPAKLSLRQRRVAFARREGCLHFLADRAALVERHGQRALHLSVRRGPLVVGLSDRRLRLGPIVPADGLLTFADRTGRWRLEWRMLLDDAGNLRRWRGNIVKPI
jgi:hypothetical protein